MTKVSVFGLGYVGCVTAACLSRDGHRVIGVDIDRDKVEAVRAGIPPVAEPGLAELLQAEVNRGSFSATTDTVDAIQNSDIALIAVGTPSTRDGNVDTRAVEFVLQSIGETLRNANRTFTIVLRSTLLPGILEDRLLPLFETALGEREGERVHLCNHPEFLRETTAIADYDKPPFIIVGARCETIANSIFALYPAGNEAPKIVLDTRTAAMVKYACNAFHAAKVAFANEIGALAKSMGADGQEVMRVLCRDKQLNISPAYLRPGYAFGGSCLPKDVRAVVRYAQREAVNIELLQALLPSNSSHIQRSIDEITRLGGKRLGLAGLSFKAGTDDLRESPMVILAESLIGRGFSLKIYDPGISISRLHGRNLAYIDRHLPHLAALLVEQPEDVLKEIDVLICGSDVAEKVLPHVNGVSVFDLRRDLVAPERRVETVVAPIGT